jgi:FMN phosphatase YigB (HAD superfamily)
VIASLRSLGVRVGILSNWDSRLPRMLAEIGVDRDLDFSVISYRVGFEKPHPAIFQEALRLAGVSAPEALHVGDSWEADIAPARELGLRALWIAPAEEARRLGLPLDTVERVDALPASVSFWARVLRGDPAAEGAVEGAE